ncbi:Crp/Fnr family transcriptional regulator [Belnapia sp. T6]|uniref:Crp/Fnr family transcriptional regulator n=1 Tax=Belnapia mucosa TaxID=2804532 RepID=A0ABS1V9X1_9PROT|nr:Crp/Fnr family transcriptional regulator [Belnapia mucosa]MBL6458460.1 Crp/Fnr family transcriptional regulator [Belnapia mucosa]
MPIPVPSRRLPARNRVLAALTPGERMLLTGLAEPLAMVPGMELARPGEPIGHLVFPEAGAVSFFLDLPDGAAEVGLVGNEGVVGLPALFGMPLPPFRAVVQVAGAALCVPVPPLALLAENSRNLRQVLRRQAMAALLQASIAGACATAHPVDARLARRLLALEDRLGPGFALTQERLAGMLGARRPTVNAALGRLRAAGMVRQTRGRIAVADRAGLEAASCPCHALEQDALAQLR